MQRMTWLGLLDFDGREIDLPGYRRTEAHADVRNDAVALLAEVVFPEIADGRAVVAKAAVYDGPEDGEPIGLTAPLSQPLMLTSGSVVAFKPGWLVR